MQIGFIGLGRAGFNLARYFKLMGHDVLGYDPHVTDEIYREAERMGIHLSSQKERVHRVQMLFLAVPDDAVVPVIESVEDFGQVSYIAHVSGVLDISALDKAPAHIERFALHPMGAFSSPIDDLDKFKTIHFGFEGNQDTYELIQSTFPEIEDRLHHIASKDKAHYHLSAVWASNLILNVLEQAKSGYTSIGIDEVDARRIVYALADTAINNYRDKGLLDALTGPVARGDVGTVEHHIRDLTGEDRSLYIRATKELIKRYSEKMSPEKHAAFQTLLEATNE